MKGVALEIGISTACFFGKRFTEDSLRSIRDAGIGVCEVFFDAPMEYGEEFYPVLRDALGGMRVHSIHGMSSQFEPQLFSLSARQRANAVEVFRRTLEQGRRLGADYYVMHGPMLQGGVVKNIAYSRIAPLIGEAAQMALDEGMRLAWENVSWCLFNRPEFVSGIAEYGALENLFFTLDIKQAARTGVDPYEFLEAMGEKCANVHLCDFTRTEAGVSLGLPGECTFDFARLFEHLEQKGYKGPALIEVYSDAFAEQEQLFRSAEYLRSLAGGIAR